MLDSVVECDLLHDTTTPGLASTIPSTVDTQAALPDYPWMAGTPVKSVAGAVATSIPGVRTGVAKAPATALLPNTDDVVSGLEASPDLVRER